MDLQHGCRSEYGPLELRIQTTDQLNGFTVYVEDPRREPICVYEQAVQSTLESAKDHWSCEQENTSTATGSRPTQRRLAMLVKAAGA